MVYGLSNHTTCCFSSHQSVDETSVPVRILRSMVLCFFGVYQDHKFSYQGVSYYVVTCSIQNQSKTHTTRGRNLVSVAALHLIRVSHVSHSIWLSGHDGEACQVYPYQATI